MLDLNYLRIETRKGIKTHGRPGPIVASDLDSMCHRVTSWLRGPIAVRNASGAAGERGERGAAGTSGERGERGAAGAAGERSAPGREFVLSLRAKLINIVVIVAALFVHSLLRIRLFTIKHVIKIS